MPEPRFRNWADEIARTQPVREPLSFSKQLLEDARPEPQTPAELWLAYACMFAGMVAVVAVVVLR